MATSHSVPFPKNFLQICKKILCRLFRVFVHVYIHHFDRIIIMGAEAHVNTCYKHFYYFVTELNLIDRKELEPLVSVNTHRGMKDQLSPPGVFVAKERDDSQDVSLKRSSRMKKKRNFLLTEELEEYTSPHRQTSKLKPGSKQPEKNFQLCSKVLDRNVFCQDTLAADTPVKFPEPWELGTLYLLLLGSTFGAFNWWYIVGTCCLVAGAFASFRIYEVCISVAHQEIALELSPHP
ncbi:MOB kinase activator 3B [Varanus komodoensis]|nr:MOB kinase activator 3B [Varanus komodoensis]